jgi:hypothetical protein
MPDCTDNPADILSLPSARIPLLQELGPTSAPPQASTKGPPVETEPHLQHSRKGDTGQLLALITPF